LAGREPGHWGLAAVNLIEHTRNDNEFLSVCSETYSGSKTLGPIDRRAAAPRVERHCERFACGAAIALRNKIVERAVDIFERGAAAMRSPIASPSTPSPSVSMTPQPSCPSAPGSDGNCIHSGPAQGVRLEAQTPQPWRRTRTCPGPGSGRATSSTLSRPGPVRTAARMLMGIGRASGFFQAVRLTS
jgi:hypothetical protein